MKRPLHLVMAFVAVITHLGAPLAAHGMPRGAPLPDDFCSTVRAAAPDQDSRGAPLPASNEHHCAHAPCCAGGAADAAVPPPFLRAFLRIVSDRDALPATAAPAAPVPPIAAAQPRGPPLSA